MKAPFSGHDVYHWPEFRALCERLGIAWELRTTHLVIEVPCDGLVTVRHEYRAGERDGQPEIVDTTTLHNKTFRTGVPMPSALER